MGNGALENEGRGPAVRLGSLSTVRCMRPKACTVRGEPYIPFSSERVRPVERGAPQGHPTVLEAISGFSPRLWLYGHNYLFSLSCSQEASPPLTAWQSLSKLE